MSHKQISSALISVYHKDGLDRIARKLAELGVRIISTGGTAAYIRNLGLPVDEVEGITDYPSIFGGRVKTLHPKVFGGILARRDHEGDQAEMAEYDVPPIDLVIVDLYPFQDTVQGGGSDAEIIEKIDIGGIALIRGAGKNHKDVVIVPSMAQYDELYDLLDQQEGSFSLEQRRKFATYAFEVSHQYDTHIFNYLAGNDVETSTTLRYGENPHQTAQFVGDMDKLATQLHGKAFSYNNLQDTHAALEVISEFEGDSPTVAILKHTNPCGLAQGETLMQAWEKALAGDPVSAFGGIIVCNARVEAPVAEVINKIFSEVLIAPSYSEEALDILKKKKKRIILERNQTPMDKKAYRRVMGGVLYQDNDHLPVSIESYEVKTSRQATPADLQNAAFGEKVGKHLKSNAIAIVKDRQLIGSGIGQTSRVDALKQAIDKAGRMGFSLEGSVVYSDAFFPFADCAEISHKAGIEVLAEPGGSVRDQETIDYCEQNGMCLVFTQHRRFKH